MKDVADDNRMVNFPGLALVSSSINDSKDQAQTLSRALTGFAFGEAGE